MQVVFHVAALIWFLGGAWAFANWTSDWGVVLACMLVSFAVTFLGIGRIIEVMTRRAVDAKKALDLLAG